MWPEPLRPPRATKSHAESPFSRHKLLKPTLRWCLTGPGPPLSARRLQPAPPPPGSTPEQALTATARAPRPVPSRPRAAVAAASSGPPLVPPATRCPKAGSSAPRPRRALTCPRPLTPAEAAAPAARLLAGSPGLRRRQESSLPLAEARAPPSAKQPPIGPGSATAAAPHAGHVDYTTTRRSANHRASAGGMCARGWRRAGRARDAARGRGG